MTRRLKLSDVREEIEKAGYTILDGSNFSASNKIPTLCPEGHEYMLRWNTFRKGVRCLSCHREMIQRQERFAGRKKVPYSQIKSMYEKEGYFIFVEEADYKNVSQRIEIRCPKGHLYTSTPHEFRVGKRCHCCLKERRRGENHPMWNPNIPEEERERTRELPEYERVRVITLKRDNYLCRCCKRGKKHGIRLQVHHLDSWKQFLEKRFLPQNLVTLCENCHWDFHRIYGMNDTTKEQFLEFLKNKNISFDLEEHLDETLQAIETLKGYIPVTQEIFQHFIENPSCGFTKYDFIAKGLPEGSVTRCLLVLMRRGVLRREKERTSKIRVRIYRYFLIQDNLILEK